MGLGSQGTSGEEHQAEGTESKGHKARACLGGLNSKEDSGSVLNWKEGRTGVQRSDGERTDHGGPCRP